MVNCVLFATAPDKPKDDVVVISKIPLTKVLVIVTPEVLMIILSDARIVIVFALEVGADVAVIHVILSGDDCQLPAVAQLPEGVLLL